MKQIITIAEKLINFFEEVKHHQLKVQTDSVYKTDRDDFYIHQFQKLILRINNNSLFEEEYSDQLYFLQYGLFRTLYDNGGYTEDIYKLLDQFVNELKTYVAENGETQR